MGEFVKGVFGRDDRSSNRKSLIHETIGVDFPVEKARKHGAIIDSYRRTFLPYLEGVKGQLEFTDRVLSANPENLHMKERWGQLVDGLFAEALDWITEFQQTYAELPEDGHEKIQEIRAKLDVLLLALQDFDNPANRVNARLLDRTAIIQMVGRALEETASI